MACFHCNRRVNHEAIRCESPQVAGLEFYLCWWCFEGMVYEGGFPLEPMKYPDRVVEAVV